MHRTYVKCLRSNFFIFLFNYIREMGFTGEKFCIGIDSDLKFNKVHAMFSLPTVG